MSPHTYAMAYEFRSDEGDYTPTDGERAMIEDAICGYLAEAALSAPALSIDAEAVELPSGRTVVGYGLCSARVIADGSYGQIANFIEDAKKDIAYLYARRALAPDTAARMEAEREEG